MVCSLIACIVFASPRPVLTHRRKTTASAQRQFARGSSSSSNSSNCPIAASQVQSERRPSGPSLANLHRGSKLRGCGYRVQG
eukprot:10498958-Alexandrium_andersonii.AAC.1